ncbi:MAG: CooT family nickel-binding protein [Deltaproteobacteria bacterium]|jgi:predicted RNA-binding protein|nr:CooT family nickel-binding protein [Deltaproteobacteria bacterium]
MCEANAYIFQNDKEELVLESVDIITPQEDDGFLLVDIFGTQKVIKGKLKQMNLVDHKIIFEA